VINQAEADGLMIASTVVNAAPTSTMNMTGFRHKVAGFTLRQRPGQCRPELARLQQPGADPGRRHGSVRYRR
jgi:hypothetical protein